MLLFNNICLRIYFSKSNGLNLTVFQRSYERLTSKEYPKSRCCRWWWRCLGGNVL